MTTPALLNNENFILNKVEVNTRDFLDSYTDHNSLTSQLPGLKTTTDLTEYPMQKMMSAMADMTNQRSAFMELMEREGTTTYIRDEKFRHKILSEGINYIVALEDLNENDPCPGLDGRLIPMKLNDPTLVRGDIVAPSSYKMHQLRCVSERGDRTSGIGWVYLFEYNPGDRTKFFPKELLSRNRKWEKLYSLVGEATSERGSFKSSLTKGWVEYGGKMATLSKQVKITDKATAQYLKFDFDQTHMGNPMVKESLPDQIINFIEAEFVSATPREEDNYMLWGVSNTEKPHGNSKTIDESSGYHINSGSGFFQHATYGNIRTYNKASFHIKEMFNQIVSLANQRISYDDYNWLIIGGSQFISMVMDSAKKEYGLSAFTTMFSDMVGPAEAIDKVNRTGAAFPTRQFTKINFDPYGSLRLGLWKELDSYQFLGGDLTYKNTPVSSWWGFCLNLGLKGGAKKNIEKLVKENSEVFGYVCGMWTPRGPVNKLTAEEKMQYRPGAHRGAYYSLEWQKTIGFNMKNASNMIWWMPNAFGI